MKAEEGEVVAGRSGQWTVTVWGNKYKSVQSVCKAAGVLRLHVVGLKTQEDGERRKAMGVVSSSSEIISCYSAVRLLKVGDQWLLLLVIILSLCVGCQDVKSGGKRTSAAGFVFVVFLWQKQSRSTLFPGDIVEYPRNKYFSHFAIYYGEKDGIPYVAHLTCRGQCVFLFFSWTQ